AEPSQPDRNNLIWRGFSRPPGVQPRAYRLPLRLEVLVRADECDMPQRPEVRARRAPAATSDRHVERRSTPRIGSSSADRFFRHFAGSMRNGVIGFRRDGTLALMNDDAYRIFNLTRRPNDMGRPFSEVLKDIPPAVRVMSAVFELSHLPNRAELRLKELDRV